MEWHHDASLIPAEHTNPGISRIGVVVYGDGLFADAHIAQCAADLIERGAHYRLQPRLSSVQA